MKTKSSLVVLCLLLCDWPRIAAAPACNAPTAETHHSPPIITLRFPGANQVSRRRSSTDPWTLLNGGQTASGQFDDMSALAGIAYEYQVGPWKILAGSHVPFVENRGKVILIVDNRFTSSLAIEIQRLEQLLSGDGWTVLRRETEPGPLPTDADFKLRNKPAVEAVKAMIRADYLADPKNVKAVFLLGHIAVPRSGEIGDGHGANLAGAKIAELYYGDMTETLWTDTYIDNATSPIIDLQNTPGDGSCDQTHAPSELELAVGRVDLSDLPAFYPELGNDTLERERRLLEHYLNKNALYRTKAAGHGFARRILTWNVSNPADTTAAFGCEAGAIIATHGSEWVQQISDPAGFYWIRGFGYAMNHLWQDGLPGVHGIREQVTDIDFL